MSTTIRHIVNGGKTDNRRRWSTGLRKAGLPFCGSIPNGYELNREAARACVEHAKLGLPGAARVVSELCHHCLALEPTYPKKDPK